VNPVTVTLALANSAVNAVSLTQAGPTGAGNLLINGTKATAGVATFDVARRVLFTPAGAESGNGTIWTIYGTSRSGAAIQETVNGVDNPTTVGTNQDFLTVTRIAVNKTQAGNVQVGTSGIASGPWIMMNNATNPINLGVGVTVTGTINFSVEYTYQDPNTLAAGSYPSVWTQSALAAKTANTDGSFTFPMWGARLTQNSFSSGATATATFIQAGIG